MAVGGRRISGAAISVLLFLAAQPVAAATFLSPHATLGYEHNSNVFMRPSDAPPFAAEGLTALGDTILDYKAGLGAELDWGMDELTLHAEGTREQYDSFSFLDHYEYSLGGNLNWRLGSVVDGTVAFVQSRYAAPFTETLTTSLLLDTERTAAATVRFLLTPEWRLDLNPELHQIDSPLPGFPEFKLRETIGTAGLDYLGFGKLTAGLQFTDTRGRYEEIAEATRYQQREIDLTANYKVSGFSTFSASAGYTRRDSEPNPADSTPAPAGLGAFAGYEGAAGTTSGATGSLKYQRQFTGRTSGYLSLFRRVDSYGAGANPEIDTGGEVGVTWKADPKITVSLSYGLARDQIKGGLIVVNAANRTDRTQTAVFDVRYAALSWLTIRPYANWDKVISTFTLGNYSATILGVDVTGRLRW